MSPSAMIGCMMIALRRDLFCCFADKKRSLGCAARWAASLGMTEFLS
jgi:hypothetical protein